ncbi:MAG TPA: hypothetical protein VEC12_11350, partial [Bacteroidia bacterium]|nr:hypothetical protein [Bacteroidia bacterium]
KLMQHRKVVQLGLHLVKRVRPYSLGFNALQVCFSFFRVVPKARLLRYRFAFSNLFQFGINVKDTSSGPLHGPLNLYIDRLSYEGTKVEI